MFAELHKIEPYSARASVKRFAIRVDSSRRRNIRKSFVDDKTVSTRRTFCPQTRTANVSVFVPGATHWLCSPTTPSCTLTGVGSLFVHTMWHPRVGTLVCLGRRRTGSPRHRRSARCAALPTDSIRTKTLVDDNKTAAPPPRATTRRRGRRGARVLCLLATQNPGERKIYRHHLPRKT